MLVGLLLLFWVQAEPAAAQAETPVQPQAGTLVTQDITADATWTADGSPYTIATTSFRVRENVTLTIEPGVVVIARPFHHFGVSGTLVAVGEAGNPIVFTGEVKAPGSWYGIWTSGTTANPASVTLEHVIIEYGSDSEFYGNLYVIRADADVRHAIFRHGGSNGISLDNSGHVQIADSVFENNGHYAVRVSGGIDTLSLANLSGSDNGNDAVNFYNYTVEGEETWAAMGLAYAADGGLFVARTGHLTLAPGVELRLGSGFYVNGRLTAEGTDDAPITLTGIEKTPGAWWGVNVSSGTFDALAHASFTHAVIEYAGLSGCETCGGLMTNTAVVTVTQSTIRSSAGHGIVDDGGAPGDGSRLSIAETTLEDNQGYPLYLTDESSNPSLHNLTIAGNDVDAIGVASYSLVGGHVWENVGAPYIVINNLYLGRNTTLAVEPGVEVHFAQDRALNMDRTSALLAVGTPANPTVFTGTTQEPGWWRGIYVFGTALLTHCDIGYGGAGGEALLNLASSGSLVQDCRIHHSGADAIKVASQATPVIRHNRIEQNAFGVRNSNSGFPPPMVDARHNWWGHAGGPQHSTNPGGQGNAVSDDVLFDPWMTTPDAPAPAELFVQISGPDTFVPGSTQTYAVAYANTTGQTLQNAVLAVALPVYADYRSSTGGTFWPERQEVYWKLGHVASGTSGVVAVEVRYRWGLPFGLKDSVFGWLGGTNLSPDDFDVAPYLQHTPNPVSAQTQLSESDVQAERQSYPQLDHLYQEALGEGFQFSVAHHLTLAGGQQATRIVLLRFQPAFGALYLWRQNDQAYAIVVDHTSYTVRQPANAVRYDLLTRDWETVALTSPAVAGTSSVSWSECMKNCIMEQIPGYVIDKVVPGVSAVNTAVSCVKAARGDELSMVECGNAVANIPGVGEGIVLGQCNSDCQECTGDCSDARCHCCTSDMRVCNSDGFPYGWFGIHTIVTYRCNLDTGRYFAGETTTVCALCDKCVQGAGGPYCTRKTARSAALVEPVAPAALHAVAANPGDKCNECQPAKDPNAKYGWEGDVVAGQLITYTITVENVGEGEAYGVFVVDELGPFFQDDSLVLYGDASFIAAANTIFWNIGELAPQGQPGATDVVSFTVRLREDLPPETVVMNGATVYFPSVPEITETNTVVNVVRPLAATPQTLETTAGQPVAITLAGMGGAGLSYEIVEPPLYGTLSGAPPSLTYTPESSFTGQDHVEFTVSSGGLTSEAALAAVIVHPSPTDTTGPSVVWTAPADGASVTAAQAPRFEDDEGYLYTPVTLIGFSEAIDSATLTTASVQLTRVGGDPVPTEITYDAALHQASILPRQPLQPGVAYQVSIAAAVADLRGNPMSADHTWIFYTGGPSETEFRLVLPRLER